MLKPKDAREEPGSPFDDTIGNQDEMIEHGTKSSLLPCKLTQDELLEVGQEMAQAQQNCEKLQAEKKASNKKFDGEIEREKATISIQSKIYRAGKMDRQVEVRVIKNFRTGMIKEVRMDTEETVIERPMAPSERQRGLKI